MNPLKCRSLDHRSFEITISTGIIFIALLAIGNSKISASSSVVLTSPEFYQSSLVS